jgi:nitrogen regulatory protein P-II 1
MQLLVAVINQGSQLDELLAGFVELGITGATVLESRGMGRLLRQELPLFAGLASLGETTRAHNHTILCVLDDAKADAAIAMIQTVCGDLGAPGAGIVFTVPVGRVVGLAPELER